MYKLADSENVRPSYQMKRRTLFAMIVCGVAAFLALAVRLWIIQIRDGSFYEERALSQQLREVPASLTRGTIYDRNNNILAVSASVENIYFCTSEANQAGESLTFIADGLARILGLDYDDILKKMEKSTSWYVTVSKKVERDKADAVRAFISNNGLVSIHLETDTKRYYPNSELACHLIGFVGDDNYGLEGIEALYDEALSGSVSSSKRLTNAYGSDILFGQYESVSVGTGECDLTTTIDETVQYYVEKHLAQAVEDYDIQNGAGAIAMDVNTGEILAMASLGGYDLNNYLSIDPETQQEINVASTKEEAAEMLREAQEKQWRNKALSDTYEPGSTFKIITLAMALEDGAVDLNSTFYCGGSVSVKGRTRPIRCWKTEGHGSQDLTKAVQHSCNAAFVNIGLRVGAERFYDYCEAFGFLERSVDADAQLTAKTGIDLLGESGSIWWSRNVFCSEKNLSQLAAASFGQTFTITPLQLITAVSACVNGGKLMKPYAVSTITDAKGNVVYKNEPQVVRRVISESTSRTVRTILEQVVGDVNDGTGRNAAVAGYKIGGKTGTSEKISLEAQTGVKEYIVSFIGFAPADDPKIAILVFLDTPSSNSGIYISGGQMAAPVVGNMLADILPYMGIYPSEETEKLLAVVPELVGCSLTDAANSIRDCGLEYRTVGSGNTVTDQLPAADSSVAKGSRIILYLGAEPSRDKEKVPDLSGYSFYEARDILSDYGLFIKTSTDLSKLSAGSVLSQSIKAGTEVDHGLIINVILIDNDDSLLGKY